MHSQLSQVAAKKKLKLEDERVRVNAQFREQGSVLAGTKNGSCIGFEIEVNIRSEESAGAIAEMLRLAHRMCFTEDVLTRKVDVTVRHTLNGEELEAGWESGADLQTRQ